MRNRDARCLVMLLLLWSGGPELQAGEPLTWADPRGPEWNRVSRERRVKLGWAPELPPEFSSETRLPVEVIADGQSNRPELWSIEGVGGVRTPLVFNDKLYALNVEQTRSGSRDLQEATEDEADAATDSPAPDGTSEIASSEPTGRYFIDCWSIAGRDPEARFRYLLEQAGPAQNADPPPLLSGDAAWRQLFCITPAGSLLALDSDLGSELWSVEIPALLGKTVSPRQISTPLVFEHLLIVCLSWPESRGTSTAGAESSAAGTVVALDRRNGQVCWLAERIHPSGLEGILPPTPGRFAGQDLLACALQPGRLEFFQIRSGKFAGEWSLPAEFPHAREVLFEAGRLAVLSSASRPDNSETPHDWRVTVLADVDREPGEVSSAESPAAIVRHVDDWDFPALAQVTTLLYGDQLLVAGSDRQLTHIDLARPADIRRYSRFGTGETGLLALDDQVLLTSRDGLWEVFAVRRGTTAQPETSLEKVYAEQWNGELTDIPVVVKQRIYVRLKNRLMCLGPLENQGATSDLIPPWSESDDADDPTPASLCIIPACQTVSPGFEISLQVLMFNRAGIFLGVAPVSELEWSQPQAGQIDAQRGVYVAREPAASPHEENSNGDPPTDATEIAITDPITVRWKQLQARAILRIAAESQTSAMPERSP